MKKILITLSIALLLINIGCKVSTSVTDDFRLLSVTGYSFQDSGTNGRTSINLFFSMKNTGTHSGTIKSWNFRLMHNIVTLLEINNNNYTNYKLELSASQLIPPEGVLEFYANTPLPFNQNAIENSSLPFNTYIPNSIVVEVTMLDSNGEEFVVSKRGSYEFEKGIIDGEKYNLLGSWSFTRTVNGDMKTKQKITFVGTQTSGNFVIYNFTTGRSEATGTFLVSGTKNITLRSSDGTKYWGEFTDTNKIEGTLLKGTSTGTWSGQKI